jgi:ABC-type multidrug transport system ATPase subunit
LLILDGATEGLAPVIRAEIWTVLVASKSEGQTILVIDKNLSAVLRLADRIVVLEKGRSVWTGTSVPNLKSAILANLRVRDTSSLFSVACLSPKCAAKCDELRGQDTSAALASVPGIRDKYLYL